MSHCVQSNPPSGKRASRFTLLASTSIMPFMLSLPNLAQANVVTIDGVAQVDNSPTNIFTTTVAGATVVNVNTQSITGPSGIASIWTTNFTGATNITIGAAHTVSGGPWGIYSTSTSGNISVAANGAVTGLTGMQLVSAFGVAGGDLTVAGGANITGTAGYGLYLWSDTGAVNINNTATISGTSSGIHLTQFTGSGVNGAANINVNNVNSTAGFGIQTVGVEGPLTINATGTINSLAAGIDTLQTTGNTTINANNINSTAGYGIKSVGFGGATTIMQTGTINSLLSGVLTSQTTGNTTINAKGTINNDAEWGVYSSATTGNILVNGGGTGVINSSGLDGIYTLTAGVGSGTNTIQNFTSITGATAGVWAQTLDSAINVQGNGTITGAGTWGVHAQSLGGNVNIGNTATNGVITGRARGIEASTLGNGNVNITTNRNVTGTADVGLYAYIAGGGAGNVNINVNGGNVTGGTYGIVASALGTGNANVNVAAGSTVQGATHGMITDTITGTATVNNAGTIQSGAANNVAFYSRLGTTVLNNTGLVTNGAVVSGGVTGLTLNNKASGVWNVTAPINTFAGTADVVNNNGLIKVSVGSSTFAGLETFNNNAGGIIDMQVVPAVTDNLTVLNFSPKAGSTFKVNFDASAAHGAGDAGGLGNADTIVVVGTSTPSATLVVNVAAVGGTNGAGMPAPLTGSIAIVATGHHLPAPAAGTTLIPSKFYSLSGLTDGVRAFALVDDGFGGVYLQWVPNVTSVTIGAYSGGDLSKPGNVGSALQRANGNFSGLGLGGVGSSGATGQINDTASNDALNQQSGNERRTCGQREDWSVWMQGDASGSKGSNGSSGGANGTSFGLEKDLSSKFNAPCGRLAVGVFATFGNSNSATEFGSSSTTSQGVGVYARASFANGLYATGMAAVTQSETDAKNNVFGSTSIQKAKSYAIAGSVGYVKRLSKTSWLDYRVTASYGDIKGRDYTDTKDFTVTGNGTKVTNVGGSISYNRQINKKTVGFVRAGVRHSMIENSATAYNTTIKGRGQETFGVLEAGIKHQISHRSSIQASAFLDASRYTKNAGVAVRFTMKF